MIDVGLTEAQQEVVRGLEKGLYIWTNEGEDLKAWVGDRQGNRLKGLRLRTVEILLDKEEIILDDGDYPVGLFRYKLN